MTGAGLVAGGTGCRIPHAPPPASRTPCAQSWCLPPSPSGAPPARLGRGAEGESWLSSGTCRPPLLGLGWREGGGSGRALGQLAGSATARLGKGVPTSPRSISERRERATVSLTFSTSREEHLGRRQEARAVCPA